MILKLTKSRYSIGWEGDLGNRLNQFTLKVLDRNREVIFEKKKIAAPRPDATFEVMTVPPKTRINRSAIDAISYVRGRETQTFNTLAELIVADQNRSAAIRSIQRVPQRFWNDEKTDQLLEVIVADLKKLTPDQRTSAKGLSIFQLAQSLTGMLPTESAAKYERGSG